jgi:hypothetical protein
MSCSDTIRISFLLWQPLFTLFQRPIHLQMMGPSYQTTTISKTVTETPMVKLFARSPTYTTFKCGHRMGSVGNSVEFSPQPKNR